MGGIWGSWQRRKGGSRTGTGRSWDWEPPSEKLLCRESSFYVGMLLPQPEVLHGVGPSQERSQLCFMAPLPPPRKGLTFVSVHDCYWTHALTVDVMNQVKVSSWLPWEQILLICALGPCQASPPLGFAP